MSLEAGALTHASRLGLLGRRSPLLRLQGDERLIALMRDGQERGFETLVDRYQVRLLAFCRGMLGSSQDAEDVLQEIFVAAHKAILADNRAINAKPWLYRIARNRCLNHLRRPVPEGQDSMDIHPHENGVSVADRVQKREEFRALIMDVQGLPETQRTALLLREIDAMTYEEIAIAMDTTVPAVKSLLVRARMSLADSSQGRHLTCGEVHLELAEAAEGLRKASGPARAHMRGCERCREYRTELRRNGKALAALAPIGPLAALHHLLGGKLELGGGAKAGAGAGAGSGAGGSAGAGSAAVGSAAAAGGGGSALGIAGSGAAAALGTKAAAGVASMALLTVGAVEVNNLYTGDPGARPAPLERTTTAMAFEDEAESRAMSGGEARPSDEGGPPVDEGAPAPADPAEQVPEEPSAPTDAPPPTEETPGDAGLGEPDSGTGSLDTANGGSSGGVIVADPPPDPPPPDPPPVEPSPPSDPPPSGDPRPLPDPAPVVAELPPG